MIHTDEFSDGILIAHETNHGDGTGTRYEYDPDGTVVNETPLAGMPVLQPNHVTFTERFDALPEEQADALWQLISHPDLIPVLTALLPPPSGGLNE